MNLLLIEDNDIKFNILSEFLHDLEKDMSITRAASYQAGIQTITGQKFDYVLLDMTLPVSDLNYSPIGVEFLTFGGQLLLRECTRKKIDSKIIVISQYNTFIRDNKELSFEQLKNEINSKFHSLVVDCIQLDRSTDVWKHELQALLFSK